MTVRAVGRVIAGIIVVALASRVAIPMTPVPITAQTLAVTVIAALYGWRLGLVTVVAWLGLAAAGLPFLAGGTSGLTRFAGPTGGYLLAFPVATVAVGWLCEHGWERRFGSALGAMLTGNAICLLIGFIWLAGSIGLAGAAMRGLMPFLPGALLKSIAGAMIVRIVGRG